MDKPNGKIAADTVSGELVPVVIGIIGHRDIPQEDVSVLENSVRDALAKIVLESPNSPHILLSSLAEGADRIGARIALECGWTLGVVLPADTKQYRNDFKSLESLQQFDELLSKAAWIETLPPRSAEKCDYHAAACRISRQSFYLIALWNGDTENMKHAGSAHTVKIFRSSIPGTQSHWPFGNPLPEARPVLHIKTRRLSGTVGYEKEEIGQQVWLPSELFGFSGENEIVRWKAILKRVDQFNEDLTKHSAEPCKRSGSMPDNGELPPSARAATGLHAMASTMSRRAQNERTRHFYWLLGLALIAIFCEQIYSGPKPDPFWLGAAIIAGVLVAFHYQKGRRDLRLEERYLDYRALSEACRVQYFWKCADIPDCAADHYLRDQRDELEWIRWAVRCTELQPGKANPDQDDIRTIGKNWLSEQRKWMIGETSRGGTEKTGGNGGKSDSDSQIDSKWEMHALILFVSGIVTTVLLLVIHSYFRAYFDKSEEDVLQWLVVTYGMFFGLAGVVAVYREVKGFKEQSKNYRRTGLLMYAAEKNLDEALGRNAEGDAPDLDEARKILLDAGRNALEENGAWLLMHRDRPVAPPF